MITIATILLFSGVYAQVRHPECRQVVLQKENLAICIPIKWYSEVQHEFNRVFTCSNPDGRCTVAVGGFPVSGTAIVVFSVLSRDDSFRKLPGPDWIRRVLRNEVPLVRSTFPAPREMSGATRATKVGRVVLLGVDLADARWVVQYFIEVSGQPTLLVTLEANTLDPNIDRYVSATEQMVHSIRLGRE